MTRFLTRFALLLGFLPLFASAELSRIEILERETLSEQGVSFTYEAIHGVMHFTLDPSDAANQRIADIAYAPVNGEGLVEYSADFRLVVPSSEVANGTLVYLVNNRGGGAVPPERSLANHPLSKLGYTYLITGWINEITPSPGRIRLHAPVVSNNGESITGDVRYELGVGAPTNEVSLGGGGHLAYAPTTQGMREASLTRRLYQEDPRIPMERSQFNINVEPEAQSTQPIVTLSLVNGFDPGYLYELIYEAKDPVLAGAGMAGIRDSMSALRYGDANADVAASLQSIGMPQISHTMAYGNSQSGRLLRMFLYDGFNADVDGRIVFDGVVPIIAGAGYGMFNNRFAMPTRTNGQHENQLYPNDLFPFTYGDSTDPFSGRTDAILKRSRDSGTEPKVMHIQTSNEYWVRAGSLPHTNPEGTEDAPIPENVRFYSIGGSQHGSGSGIVGDIRNGQLPPNPNMWAPFADSLLVAMEQWIRDGGAPPQSKYPRISDGSLVPSHLPSGQINPAAWNVMPGINHPRKSYIVGRGDYGPRFERERIIDNHPTATTEYYGNLVPAVNTDNNDFGESTLLPPLTAVPLASFLPWNLRNVASGAETELARLAGGYIPYSSDAASAADNSDPRSTIDVLYSSFQDYLGKYEAATDELISAGYLLPEYKETFMGIARQNEGYFD